MTKNKMRILVAALIAFPLAAAANTLPQGVSTNAQLSEVTILKLNDAKITASSDKGHGILQTTLTLSVSVEGNICGADPTSLTVLVEKSNQLRLLVKNPTPDAFCLDVSTPRDINVELTSQVSENDGRNFIVGDSTVVISVEHGVASAIIH